METEITEVIKSFLKDMDSLVNGRDALDNNRVCWSLEYRHREIVEYLKRLPRYATTRWYDVAWKFSCDFHKHIRQHHVTSKGKVKPPSTMNGIREWILNYGL